VKRGERDEGLQAYEKHLWQVLAVLSRAGYFVPPQDARDLIHDFYLEEWDGVMQRYDSTLSGFPTYISAAFYRFARRRILKLQRWRQRTVDLEEAAEQASAGDMPEQVLEQQEQLAMIRAALGNLPAQEREIIYDFLTRGEANERALAQQHAMTRYRLRETLVNGLGRLLIQLPDQGETAGLPARVARGLWVDGYSSHQLAALLGMSTPEVNAVRLEFVAELIDSLRQLNHQTKEGKESHESRSRDTESGADLYR
jgi:RNA polymerase sigma factor (sigma-70 family)